MSQFDDVWVNEEFAEELSMETGFHQEDEVKRQACKQGFFAIIKRKKLVKLEEGKFDPGGDIWTGGIRQPGHFNP